MLKSYEAICEDSVLTWVSERPSAKRMKVLVTVLEEETDAQTVALRKAAFEKARGRLKPGKSIEEIDADVREMRSDWQRDWDQ